MIKNCTALSDKDIQFIAAQAMKAPLKKIVNGILTALGVLVLLASVYLLIFTDSSKIQWILYLIIGILGGIAGLNEKWLYILRLKHTPGIREKRSYEFEEDCIYCLMESGGIRTEQKYPYSVAEKYYQENQAVYLQLNYEKRKLFIVLHDNAYTEGTKEELLSLLKSKGISE